LALNEPLERGGGAKIIRLFDSHIFGNVNFAYNQPPNLDDSVLEVVQSEIVGEVRAANQQGRVVITDSSIKGSFSSNCCYFGEFLGSQSQVLFSHSSVEGAHVRALDTVFDTVTVHGGLILDGGFAGKASVRGSYIYFVDQVGAEPGALSVRTRAVRLEQTFVQGTPAVVVPGLMQLEVFSSVLLGPVLEPAAGTQISCTDTHGADYELLNATCQPQVP
jgi:hypothetical protein